VIVVADSSPLIVLAKIGCLDLVKIPYPRLYISEEVYAEVVVAGAGMPGAAQVAKAGWIEVKPLANPVALHEAEIKYRLGPGEVSTVLLAKEINAEIALLDDLRARRLALNEGVAVRGSVGILELLYRGGHLPDLRSAFLDLLAHSAYIDRPLLEERLRALSLPPLESQE
jgi:predicted nucleic acid-binding protein